LNKPIIKSKLEQVPEYSYVLIDSSRADFIDKDIIETIEDFMLHAHLKNIRVELKQSQSKTQGFSQKLPPAKNKVVIRTHEKDIMEEVH